MSSMNCECSDKEPIHILLVDDDEDDYILTRDLLAEASGTRFELKWVCCGLMNFHSSTYLWQYDHLEKIMAYPIKFFVLIKF